MVPCWLGILARSSVMIQETWFLCYLLAMFFLLMRQWHHFLIIIFFVIQVVVCLMIRKTVQLMNYVQVRNLFNFIMIFLFILSLLVRWLLLYTSYVLSVPYAFNDIWITYQKKKKTCLTLHCIYYLILLFMVSCCNVLETMSTRLKSLALAHGQHQLYVPEHHSWLLKHNIHKLRLPLCHITTEKQKAPFEKFYQMNP